MFSSVVFPLLFFSFSILIISVFILYLTKRFEYLRRLFSHLQATFSSGNSPSSPSDKDRKTSCSSSIAADQGGKKKKSKKGSSVEWNNSHSNSLTNEAQNIFRSLVPQWSPQVSLQYWQSDAVKPIIVITFTTSSSLRLVNGSSVLKSSSTSETICGETDLSQWIVRIFPVPPSSPESHSLDSQGHSSLPLFRESLLGPERNCVRRPSFLSWKEEEDEEEDVTQSGSIKKRRNEEEEQSLRHVLKGDLSKGPRKGGGDEHHEVTLLRPTPYYNGLLLEDIFMKKHSSLLQKCCAMFGETFRITVHLLKIWALRRSPGLLTLSQNEKAMRLSMASSPTKEAARSRMSSIPATGVNGFTLAMMCGHACLSGGLDESSSINPRQLLSLTFSFLSRADFLNYFYIFGDPQPHSRDTLLLRNKPNMTGRAAGTDSLEEGWAVGQQPGLSSVSKKASKAGGQVQPANKNHANQDEANQRKSLLAAGLISEAFLFDSPSCSCNLLFRSQLHIPELQAMARESLHALEKLEDPFDFLFGGLPKLLNAEGAYRCSGKKGQMPVPASLLLANDVQVYIPQISSTLLKRAMRPFMTEGFPAIADYVPSVEGGQGSHSDERASERGVARATQGENRNEVQQNDFSTLDEGVKWEASPARLFAEALVRFCVRALGDRLDLVQVRFVHPTYSGLTAELHPLLSANVKELSKEESFLEKEDSALANLPLAFPSYEALSAACDIPVGVLLSLRLRGEAISRALDRGPPATGVSSSDEAIQSFKSFWGTDIVELRRFQDGQILHTVLWQKDECCGRESNGRIADIPSNSRKCLPLLPPISCVCGKVHAPPHTQILSHLFHRHWSRVLALRGQEWVSTVKEAEGEQSLHEVAPTHTGGEGRKPGDPLTTDVKRADCWMQGTILGGTASSAGAAQKQMRKQLMQFVQMMKSLALKVLRGAAYQGFHIVRSERRTPLELKTLQ
ncbi:nrap protein [Cystoisospora suis]|uniref:Nrap protein n=1 Tax=Cystoisospora suis TaxID=483139 RepID=A0A2C6LF85_9APIC|nr:nrap protein [Cystoisospora suis]